MFNRKRSNTTKRGISNNDEFDQLDKEESLIDKNFGAINLSQRNSSVRLEENLNESINSIRFNDQEGLVSAAEDVEQQLTNTETRQWAQRVMQWTNNNRRAYVSLKLIQTLLSITLLATTLFFFRRWRNTQPKHELIAAVKLIIAIHAIDLLTYLFDFVMVYRRLRFLISARFITNSVSFTLGIIVMTMFYQTTTSQGVMTLNMDQNIFRLVGGTVFYIYQMYLVWAVMNTFMYF